MGDEYNWRPITNELTSRCLVVQKAKDGRCSVAIGNPGQRPGAGMFCSLVCYADLPPPISEDPAGWYCEFRGDDLPRESGWYLAQVIQNQPGRMRHRIRVVYFDYARYEWLAMGDGEEVYAWRELPAVPGEGG